jgi:predicted nucleotidyltransferase
MQTTNSGISPRIIQQVADDIARRFHPQQVILFGSCAYGTPTQDSDVDILVTMETQLPNVQQAVDIRKAIDFPFPTDLLVRTPQQLEERLAIGDVFFQEIMAKGVRLYEARVKTIVLKALSPTGYPHTWRAVLISPLGFALLARWF